MNVLSTAVPRRRVIETYAVYESRKKNKSLPDLATWDWSSADRLDKQLEFAGLKRGVLSGYVEWCLVALGLTELRACAVVTTISNGGPRDLGSLERVGKLRSWRPRGGDSTWSNQVADGTPFTPETPFILRPATRTEYPGRWYLEDGSGRATAIVANASKYSKVGTVAHGFLGLRPDFNSSFMQTYLPELLKACAQENVLIGGAPQSNPTP
jgi:hypothetical protein